MKKIVLIIFSFSLLSFGGPKERRILNLVKLEIRSIAKIKNRDHNMSYRLFELYSERLQLLRTIENEKVFAGVVRKESAYNQTNRLFVQTQEFGKHFLLKYKKSRHLPEVYIRLASNIIHIKNDLSNHELAIKTYLKKALQLSDDVELKYKANVTLAELDYNLNRYKSAAKYYNEVVRNSSDPAHTKHLLNYSWCLFKLNNYENAISLVKKSFKLSKQYPNKYDDTRSRVGKAINYFYTYNKQPERAIDFHGKYFKSELANNAVAVVELSLKRISSQSAMSAESRARKYCTGYKNYECLFRLSQLKLDVLKAGKKYNEHRRATISIGKEYAKLPKKLKDSLENETSLALNNIGETTQYMQTLGYKNIYLINKSKKNTYEAIVGNYDVLKVLKPEMQYEYAFLQGEISYKEKYLDNAAKFYKESYQLVKKDRNQKTTKKKVLNAMLGIANEESFQNDKFFEFANVEYLKTYPREKKSQGIYENLFNFYFGKEKFLKAEKIVKAYHQKIPSKVKIQRDMQTTLTDHYIKRKDTEKVMKLLGSYQRGYLSYPKSFIDKNIAIFGGLVFEKAKKIEDSGDILKAQLEYEKIFNNKLYPKEIRYNAAFNVGINKLKQHKTEEAYTWIKSVIEKDSSKNIANKIDGIMVAAQKFYLLQKIDFAKEFYGFVSRNHCKTTKNFKNHYPQIQELNLATNDYRSFESLESNARACNVPNTEVALAKKSYIESLVLNNKSGLLVSKMKRDSQYLDYQNFILDHIISNYWSGARPSNLGTNNANYQNVVGFLSGNQFATKKVIDKVQDIKSFERFAKESINQQYVLNQQGAFSFPSFEQDFTDKMNTLNIIKERGLKLAEASSDPDVYSAILAIVHKNFVEFRGSVESFKVNTEDAALKVEVENNLSQIVAGLRNQENEFFGTYSQLKKKNKLKNHFVKLFRSSEKRSSIATSIDERELLK